MLDRSIITLVLVWVNLGLNIVIIAMLGYYIWRIQRMNPHDFTEKLLGVDRALHQRVDSMESTWTVKWENLTFAVARNASKIRRIFSASDNG